MKFGWDFNQIASMTPSQQKIALRFLNEEGGGKVQSFQDDAEMNRYFKNRRAN
jgi:hypothetical protein